jgi:hypothetical protein
MVTAVSSKNTVNFFLLEFTALSAFALDAINSLRVLRKSEVGLSDFIFHFGSLVEVERDGDEIAVPQMLSLVLSVISSSNSAFV